MGSTLLVSFSFPFSYLLYKKVSNYLSFYNINTTIEILTIKILFRFYTYYNYILFILMFSCLFKTTKNFTYKIIYMADKKQSGF